MYIHRAIEQTVLRIHNSFPVLLITGPRQVGKTTLLLQLAESNRQYVTLDDPLVRELAAADPTLFIQRYQPPVIIDEIQYAPQLLPYIKMNVDRHKRNGDYWLTGSQMFHLMKHTSESLAGRVGIVNLLGLSQRELSGRSHAPFTTTTDFLMNQRKEAEPQTLTDVFKRIHTGSMPALYAINPPDVEIFYSSYMQTYLQRDVKDSTQVGDELAFIRFVSSVAARTGQMVNYADLAKDTGISSPTAKNWLSILVSSGIVAIVEPYYNNTLKRLIKTPKMYMIDTGLCAYLTKWTSPEALEAGAMSGALFETWVVVEIMKSYMNSGRRPPLYYYRDKDKREIDLVLYENNTLYPIEVKKSGSPNQDAIRHFDALAHSGITVGDGCVICMSSDLIPLNRNNWFVPAWML